MAHTRGEEWAYRGDQAGDESPDFGIHATLKGAWVVLHVALLSIEKLKVDHRNMAISEANIGYGI
jgi:hypothetical protein